MTVFLWATGLGVALVVVLALILPCPACRLRRERMRDAYTRWRAHKYDNRS